MYKELRSTTNSQESASTPQMWAENFAESKRMSTTRASKIKSTHDWKIVRKYFAPGGRILDAGCGFGEWVYLLRDEGYDAFGLDYSPTLIQRLRATYPAWTWLQSDIRSMPLKDGEVDGIISWGVIEHDEAGPEAALREFHRVVNVGGTIMVTVPVDSREQRKSSQVQFPQHGDMTFFQYFMTEDELAERVRNAGFEVVETGVLANASFAIFAPHIYIRMAGLPLRIANRIGSTLLRPFKRYWGMAYCVGRKPLSVGNTTPAVGA